MADLGTVVSRVTRVTTAWIQDVNNFIYRNIGGGSGSSLVGYTASGTDAVARTVQAKLRESVSVLDFGATGDGTTDDSAAIQLAATAAAGGRLVMPAGQYFINGSISLPSSITIEGDGDATVLLLNGTFLTATSRTNIVMRNFKVDAYDATTPRMSFTLCGNLTFENITMDGNITHSNVLGSMAIGLYGCTDVVVDKCKFFDYADNIYLDKSGSTNSDRVTVRNCHFQHTAHGSFFSFPTCVYQYNCDHLLVDGCTALNFLQGGAASGNTSYLVYEGDGTAIETVVVNCRDEITENTTKPHALVLTSEAANARVQNCSMLVTDLASTGGNLCIATASESLQIIGNYAYNARYQLATFWQNCKSVICTGNECVESPFWGIRIGGATYGADVAIVTANRVSNAGYGGIFFSNVFSHFTCADNIVVDCNTSNTAHSVGSNEDRVAAIGVSGPKYGTVSGNFAENTMGGAGHMLYGFASSGTTHAINVTPDNRFLHSETAVTFRGITSTQRPGAYPFHSRGMAVYYTDPTNGAIPGELCTDSRSTTLSGAEASGQTVLSLTSASGMAVNDWIAIELDSGAYHASFITAIAGNDVTISAATTGDAAAGNEVRTNRFVRMPSTFLIASATYDPPSLADGAGATTTITCTGAAVGDFAAATFSNDLQGITVTAWVSSSNTVSVRFQNESGGLLDLSSGTLRVRVTKV